tara:strand:- start:4872 stop:5054 length:183 start_codon:yes stop_codon:yes gene_type:complete
VGASAAVGSVEGLPVARWGAEVVAEPGKAAAAGAAALAAAADSAGAAALPETVCTECTSK